MMRIFTTNQSKNSIVSQCKGKKMGRIFYQKTIIQLWFYYIINLTALILPNQ